MGERKRRRVRRRAARRLPLNLEAKLTATRAKLQRAPSKLAAAEHDLPPAFEVTIARARQENLTYLTAEQLRSLAAAVLDAERRVLPGLTVEAGTARVGDRHGGGQGAGAADEVYDVFGMIRPRASTTGSTSTSATRRSPLARRRGSAATRTTATATASTTR